MKSVKLLLVIATAFAQAALVFAVPAWGDNWAAEKQQATVVVSPERSERAASVATQKHLAMLDARERALEASVGNGKVSALEARERSFGAKQASLISAQSPDWFERAAAAAIRTSRVPVVDDRFRIDPTSVPAPVTVSSGRELEWPQIGIGFGVGIVLVLGLYLAMKATRPRPLAH